MFLLPIMKTQNLQHLFNSKGEWIAFRIDSNVFNPQGFWVGFLPWDDSEVFDTRGFYLGHIYEYGRFYQRTDPIYKGYPEFPKHPGYPGCTGAPLPLEPQDLPDAHCDIDCFPESGYREA